MQSMLSNIKIKVNEKIYVKDPETSTLGKKILQESIFLIDKIGFDSFTFKKLGDRIGSNESSIYRYFENKHKLLVYLCSWYWSWIEYQMVFKMMNIDDPMERLKRAITVVTQRSEEDLSIPHINEAVLNKIIITEFTKTLHTKEIDDENKEGFFFIYKSVINRIVSLIIEIKPDYPFPKSLASSIIEGALHQYFLEDHLKSITNCNELISPTDFYLNLIDLTLRKK